VQENAVTAIMDSVRRLIESPHSKNVCNRGYEPSIPPQRSLIHRIPAWRADATLIAVVPRLSRTLIGNAIGSAV